MAKKKATVSPKTTNLKAQQALIKAVYENAVSLAALKAGAPIDNIATQLEKLSNLLVKRFDRINNAAENKAARQAKYKATRIKLLERLQTLDEKLEN